MLVESACTGKWEDMDKKKQKEKDKYRDKEIYKEGEFGVSESRRGSWWSKCVHER